jgi:anti-sigma regulatory factor (Ser/Thr protein kinase)
MVRAMNGWLTCESVEELQQAAEVGRPTATFVNSLKAATLPGIVEYGCAKWHRPSLPSLPPSIASSPLGRALLEVKSDLGLRKNGEQRLAPRTITPEMHEFYVLDGDEPTVNRDWREFLIRFRQSAKHVGFSQDKAQGLAAALGEMADNATLHARAKVGVLVGYHVVDGAAVCSVADVGIGVLASLREHEDYRDLETHAAAIRTALQDGTTRYGTGDGGYGFRNVFKALAAMRGTLRFRSGQGCISMDGTACDADRGEEMYVLDRPGFQVTICCRTSDESTQIPLL